MNSKYFVILTGGKNNAGDFLIKFRAKQLLEKFRPDRAIIDFNGWEAFDSERLDIVNGAEAVLLTGGPALQKEMRPRVYGLTSDLSDISPPMATMGIGWYSPHGRWRDTHSYDLNGSSLQLLDRLAHDGLISSVRDYHTLNVLASRGYRNFLMTGCPAYYSLPHIGTEFEYPKVPQKIAVSLGASLRYSRRMTRQMRNLILATREIYPKAQLTVVFHHGISDDYLRSSGMSRAFFKKQLAFADWLSKEGISFIDISGAAEKLVDFYTQCDLHVGYRIHAHIFMSSISKPSILITEDGRGKALRHVLGGVSLDSYKKVRRNKFVNLLHRLGIPFDDFVPAKGLIGDYSYLLSYELESGVRLGQPRKNIDTYFALMKRFICLLP